MKQSVERIINQLIERYPQLQSCKVSIERSFIVLQQCYSEGGKVLICGNGGSASDSEHIVGELMKSFIMQRQLRKEDIQKFVDSCPAEKEYFSKNLQSALPAISLVSQSALCSAYGNDVAADMVFAQQVYGYGRKGDVLLGLSTSGNSLNVVNAIKVAKAIGMKTIGFTGDTGGKMRDICDLIITVPARETFQVQELHLPVYHAICAMLEEEFFGK